MDIRFPWFDQRAVNAIKKLPTRQFVPAGSGGPLWRLPDALVPQAAEAIAPYFPNLAKELRSKFPEASAAQETLTELRQAKEDRELSNGRASALVEKVRSRLKIPKGEKLFPFQEIGVAFIELAKGRALLGDQMGLGKTITTLAWLSMHPKKRPAIAFVPGKLRSNWEREINRWLPGEAIRVIRTGKESIEKGSSVYVISYELAAKHITALNNLAPKVVILDESTRIANKRAQRARATLSIAKNAPHVIALTGTPIRNRTAEFFNTLNLIQPEIFPNRFKFGLRFCQGYRTRFGWDFSGSSNSAELYQLLKPIMIRRLKSDVLAELPPKRRATITVELPSAWAGMYKAGEDELMDALTSFRKYQDRTRSRDFEEEYQKYLVDFEPTVQVEPDDFQNFVWGAAYAELGKERMLAITKLGLLRQIVGLGKSELVPEIAEDFFNAGEKLVIFGHHKEVLDKIAYGLQENNRLFVRVDGRTPDQMVAGSIDTFQNDPKCVAFLGSTLAAGMGITLTAASNVLVVERQWTPSDEEQGEDRCHRIGQKNSVTIWYMVVKDSVDDKLNSIVESKRRNIDRVIEGKESVGDTPTSVIWDVMKDYIKGMK